MPTNNTKRIFIIEDDAGISEALVLTLQFEGYETCLTTHTKDLHEQLVTFKPHIILLDLFISGSDGKTVAKELKSKKSTSQFPIILMSAHPSAHAIAQEIGVEDFIAKPFDTTDLLKKINRLV